MQKTITPSIEVGPPSKWPFHMISIIGDAILIAQKDCNPKKQGLSQQELLCHSIETQ